jgi:hypothetical protein
MANATGKVKATTPDPSGPKGADSTLPDPTLYAKWVLFGLIVIAALLAVAMNGWWHSTKPPFEPSSDNNANFTLFAGFYVAAQVIERLIEVVSPLFPPLNWLPSDIDDGAAKAAHLKADRAAYVLGVASVAGVAASAGFGLYFLAAVGLPGSNTIDSIATGLLIGAGTKPLHDLITSIQNKNTPTTGTTT